MQQICPNQHGCNEDCKLVVLSDNAGRITTVVTVLNRRLHSLVPRQTYQHHTCLQWQSHVRLGNISHRWHLNIQNDPVWRLKCVHALHRGP